MSRKYECVFLFDPDLTDESISQELEAFEKLVKTNKGTVTNTSTPKRTELGYERKKKSQALYVVCDFEIAPEAIKALDKTLKLKDVLLRYMISVRAEKKTVNL